MEMSPSGASTASVMAFHVMEALLNEKNDELAELRKENKHLKRSRDSAVESSEKLKSDVQDRSQASKVLRVLRKQDAKMAEKGHIAIEGCLGHCSVLYLWDPWCFIIGGTPSVSSYLLISASKSYVFRFSDSDSALLSPYCPDHHTWLCFMIPPHSLKEKPHLAGSQLNPLYH